MRGVDEHPAVSHNLRMTDQNRQSDKAAIGADAAFDEQLALARMVIAKRRAMLEELAQIELAEKIMAEDRNILRKLAE
jgi:hypothetical protein